MGFHFLLPWWCIAHATAPFVWRTEYYLNLWMITQCIMKMKMMTDREAILALREAQLKEGHLYNTRRTYRGWMIRYRKARRARACRDFQGYLDLLSSGSADIERVSPKTVHQALNALVFYHNRVLGIAIPPKSLRVPKLRRHRNIPQWLTHREVIEVLAWMKGTARLQAELLYATGGRPTALLKLRLKDVELEHRLVTFRFDKGGKSRTVRLPEVTLPALAAHIGRIKLQWKADHAAGLSCPSPEPSLVRKLGSRVFSTLPWYWLFPSQQVRGANRWHASNGGLAKSVRNAAEAAGITKRVTLRSFRHAHATALLHRGTDIRTIQEQLGHSNLETTEIYTHAVGSRATPTPLDLPPAEPCVEIPVIPFPESRHPAAVG